MELYIYIYIYIYIYHVHMYRCIMMYNKDQHLVSLVAILSFIIISQVIMDNP